MQSAVSQQISQLEGLVGVRLVDRVRGHAPPVQLTEAGLLLLEHAGRILSQFDAAEADLRALTTDGVTTLRIGVEPSVATRLVPPTLTRVARLDAPLEVVLEEAATDRAHMEKVESGELDAAFAELPLEPGPFEFTEILVDPCVLIVPRESPLAAPGTVVELADVVGEPLIASGSWPMMELVESHLRSAGLAPRFTMRTDGNATVQALVGAGVGSAILPRLAVNEDDPHVATIPLGELLPSRRVVLYWHEGRRQREALSGFGEAARAAGRAAGRAYRDADAVRAAHAVEAGVAEVVLSR